MVVIRRSMKECLCLHIQTHPGDTRRGDQDYGRWVGNAQNRRQKGGGPGVHSPVGGGLVGVR